MIKFFNKIRGQATAENRFGKYLVYAIGEIVLVVIGILIALQIDNWNDQHHQNKLEIKYLNEIRDNLTSSLEDINFNIRFNEQRRHSNKQVLRFLNKEIEYSDSLEYHFANLPFSTRTIANSSAYENIKARGLEIISNDSLRQRITQLYSFDFHNITDFENQDDHAFQYTIFVPTVSKALAIKQIFESASRFGWRRL